MPTIACPGNLFCVGLIFLLFRMASCGDNGRAATTANNFISTYLSSLKRSCQDDPKTSAKKIKLQLAPAVESEPKIMSEKLAEDNAWKSQGNYTQLSSDQDVTVIKGSAQSRVSLPAAAAAEKTVGNMALTMIPIRNARYPVR